MTGTRAPILAVIDPTATRQPAAGRAAELARHMGAPLALFACLYDPYLAGERFFDGTDLKQLRKRVLEQQLGQLHALAEPWRTQGLTVTCRAVWDQPLHEGIVREALRTSPAFVVKDTHHHSVLERTLLTNTDWHLIRECPFPLWLVKDAEPGQQACVVAAVDPLHRHDKPGALDRRIIARAQEIGVLFEERVHLAHVAQIDPVLPPFPMGAPLPVELDETQCREIRTRHQEALDRLAADTGFPAEQTHLRQGTPAEALCTLATELGAGAVVMGAVARSPLRRAVIGSTAEHALEWMPCDVVVVKPEGFETPVDTDSSARGYMALLRD